MGNRLSSLVSRRADLPVWARGWRGVLLGLAVLLLVILIGFLVQLPSGGTVAPSGY
jgi:hypothetical protein